MKNYSNKKSSKVKSVILVVVLMLMFVLIGGLIGAVVTGTKPQEWFQKEQPTVGATSIKDGDVISLSVKKEGLPLYINTDTKVLDAAILELQDYMDSDFGFILFHGLKLNSVSSAEGFTEDDFALMCGLCYGEILSDFGVEAEGLCIMISSVVDDDAFFMEVLYDFEAKEFGDAVGKDGRVLLSDVELSFEAVTIDGEIAKDFFSADCDVEKAVAAIGKIFSTTPFEVEA